jgi:hypothetical protein
MDQSNGRFGRFGDEENHLHISEIEVLFFKLNTTFRTLLNAKILCCFVSNVATLHSYTAHNIIKYIFHFKIHILPAASKILTFI